MLSELPEENMTILGEIARERQRQIDVEGWTPEHDDEHDKGELAIAAACYAWRAVGFINLVDGKEEPPPSWPWDKKWWKPKSPHRDLIRAAALLHAELERQGRLARESEDSGDG